MTDTTYRTSPSFDAATRPSRVDDTTFALELDDQWNGLTGAPLGGLTLASGLRALGEAMPFPDPLVVSAYFLRPARPGEVVADAELVRSGRSLATGQATLAQHDREIMRLLATFGDLGAASGLSSMQSAPPELPAPDACLDPLGGLAFPGVTITDRVEYRFTEPPGWLTGTPSGAPVQTFWMRLRDGTVADLAALTLLVDAAAPAVLELGAAGSSTLELTVHLRGRPTTDWLACRCSTRHLVDGYHEEDFELWDGEGTLVAQSRQLAIALG